jgi:hypothetical protein
MLPNPDPLQPAGQIVRLSAGWVLSWGGETYAVRSASELGKLVARLAARKSKPPPLPVPPLVPPPVSVPAVGGGQRVISPELARLTQVHNLDALAGALVQGLIDDGVFQEGLRRACPDATPDDVQEALDRAERMHYATAASSAPAPAPPPAPPETEEGDVVLGSDARHEV